jgi:hypothetical protein
LARSPSGAQMPRRQTTRLMTRLMTWALAAILLFGFFPVLTLLLALLFASAFGCDVNEGSVHPCVVLGVDFGGLLYPMAVGGWFAMFTIPLALLALIVWLIVLIVLLLVRRHRRAGRTVEVGAP